MLNNSNIITCAQLWFLSLFVLQSDSVVNSDESPTRKTDTLLPLQNEGQQVVHRNVQQRPLLIDYEPHSDVTNYASIDQDIKAIQSALSPSTSLEEGFNTVNTIYVSSSASVSLREMTETAEATMYKCDHCPYEDYDKFFKYYGKYDYADEFMRAAVTQGRTELDRGGYDFSTNGERGLKKFVEKSVVVLHIWMYIISEMEQAIDVCTNYKCSTFSDGLCQDNTDRYINNWDQAVALYVGSEQQVPTENENPNVNINGYLLYHEANLHCVQFGTCGADGESVTGAAKVNREIITMFTNGKRYLLSGNCGEARNMKQEIVKQMTVPLIQGMLLDAGLKQLFQSSQIDGGDGEQNNNQGHHYGFGAAYAASLLPIIYSCNEADALTIYNHLRPQNDGSSGGGELFTEVKRALENNYDCMGITCEQVGGILRRGGGAYRQGAEPCGDYNPNPPVVDNSRPEQQQAGSSSSSSRPGHHNNRPFHRFRNHGLHQMRSIPSISAAVMVLLSGCCVLLLCRTWKTDPMMMIKDGDNDETYGIEIRETPVENGNYHNGTSNNGESSSFTIT